MSLLRYELPKHCHWKMWGSKYLRALVVMKAKKLAPSCNFKQFFVALLDCIMSVCIILQLFDGFGCDS